MLGDKTEKNILKKILDFRDDLVEEVGSLQIMLEKDLDVIKKEIEKLHKRNDTNKEEGIRQESFKCDKCNFCGEDQDNLEIHREIKHGVWFQCDRCKFSKNEQAHFKRHKETFIHRSK